MANWKFYLDGIEVEEPIGWDAVEFTAVRMESHGIDQPFSTEVKFYERGARYIKSIFDQYFINQPIAITITSDVGYNNAPYEFQGFLNMAIYQEHNVCDTDTWEITVGIIDDEFREQFKSRQDVEIDLNGTKDLNDDTIPALTYRNIRLHKQELFLEAYGRNWADFTGFTNNSTLGPGQNKYILVPTYWTQKDFTEQFGSAFDTNQFTVTGLGNMGTTSPIFKNNMSITRTLEYKIEISFQATNYDLAGNVDVALNLGVFNGNILNYPPGVNLFLQTLTPGQVINVTNTYTGTITVDPGFTVSLFFFQSFSTLNNAIEVTIYDGYKIKFTEINRGEYASLCDVLTIEQWLNRAIYIMTGSNNKLLSNTFSESGGGCYWNNALTNGLRIRGSADISGFEQLKTSWKFSFDNLNKIFCLGWAFEWTGSEWKIRVEPREYFYQNLLSQTFANVGEIDQIAKVDILKNNFTLGYTDKWKNIQLTGTYAVHTDRNYFVPNKAMNEGSTAKEDLRSEIIAEGICIEFYRRMSTITQGGATSDRPNDYDIFIIWLNNDDVTINPVEISEYALPEETGSVVFLPGTISLSSDVAGNVSGFLNGLYNIYHSPARVAYRWWKVLGMHTYGVPLTVAYPYPNLRYQVGQYQTTFVSSVDPGYVICEMFALPSQAVNENYPISPLILADAYKDYLFKPIEVNFSYPQSLCDFLTLSQDEQYRKVRLTSGSLVIEGFITNATNQPEDASGGTTNFTLLMSNLDSALGGAFDAGFDDGYDNG
jgi:hypothetical protein